MKKNATKLTLLLFTLLLIAVGYWAIEGFNFDDKPASEHLTAEQAKKAVNDIPEQEEISKVESKKARNEYFFRLLRNPATNSIPDNIRARELNHAKRMPTMLEIKSQIKAKYPSVKVAEGFNWLLAGPPAVGGRTRALGIDQRDPDIIIAGGVSGGIWRSTDGGDSWTLRTPDFDNFSVTSLAQDPTNPDTWYYTAGEFTSGSPGAPGAPYFGTGIFRSVDNGLTWSRIPGTEDDDAAFNSRFDFINRIIVNPTTGSVFVASNGVGILRSPNGNNYDDITLGGLGDHAFADIAAASDSTLVAVLSSADASTQPADNDPGIFFSDDDGKTWTEITPASFPTDYGRSVITFAPSDPNIIYVFTQKIQDDSNQGVSFHKIDLSGGVNNPASEDRSANLPDFGEPVGGVNLQGGYNMTVSVKPDDPDVVTLGGTNLFRSFDGFATAPSGDSDAVKDEFWIGGYAKANNVSQYPNQHPDQHVQIYDPTNPDRLWVGHDGGLSVTEDIQATDVNWTERNDGYIVTQFFDVSIGLDQDDPRFMGGTQDNGTPLFEFDEQSQNVGLPSNDISSGDGAFSFFTENFIFVSTQNGFVRRCPQNDPSECRFGGNGFSFVHPSAATDQFFIHPYTVDPNDDTIMYYPGGSSLFRNTEIDEISSGNADGTTQGWEELNAATTPGFNISALAVTTLPSDILYYAGSNDDDAPIVRRLNNASTSNEDPTDISIPGVAPGAFVHDLAINPANGQEVLVVMSNYNITGLYHTNDGGNSWNAVEGNLTGGDLQGNLEFGPSLRSATIVPAESGPIYLLGTSTGVYATQSLDGDNTQWGRESAFDNDGLADIGFSVVENITSRFSDGDVAVGSHGRGIFVGRFQGEIADSDIPFISLNLSEGQAGDEIIISSSNFQFSATPSEIDVTFAGVPAEVVDATPTQITVIVPRNTLDPTDDDRTVPVSVDRENGVDPSPISFTILPPGENNLSQNFPNPFSTGEGTSIPISLQNNSSVTLQIYDTTGRLIFEPLSGDSFQAGTFDIPVRLNNNASGVYIYHIIAKPDNSNRDTFVDSEKFTFIR
jgi:photosystem II stability/assembly factor-like uncharacterized protein